MSHELNFPPKPPCPITITPKTSKVLSLEDLGLEEPAPEPTAGQSQQLPQEETKETKTPFWDEATAREFAKVSERKDLSTLFDVRSGTEWLETAATMTVPRMLFDTMWYEGDLCILFADTNVGKSILAVQIGDSISRGVPIPGFGMDAGAHPVAYFDFELSARQFLARYSSESAHYPFADTFYRAELDMTADYTEWGYKSFEAYLYAQLEHYVERSGTRILIIDNLTYLRSEAERSKDAYTLMNVLITLKRKYDLSMLVLAHTPKRDHSKPLDVNHLQGSKQIANLCDSIIAIGKSQKDNGLRYIKQIKHRIGEKKYEEDNVCLCQVIKPHDFLHFELMGHCREREHLSEMADKEVGQKLAAVKDLSRQGKSQRDIAAQLGISVGAVNKYLKKAAEMPPPPGTGVWR